jgi:hypothetical protein
VDWSICMISIERRGSLRLGDPASKGKLQPQNEFLPGVLEDHEDDPPDVRPSEAEPLKTNPAELQAIHFNAAI